MRGVLVPGLLLVLAGAGCVSGESLRPRGPARQRLLDLPRGPDVVRLSIGLEDKDDIIADLDQGLALA